MSHNNIENWIKGKNALYCMFALDIVSGVDDVFAACQIAEKVDLRERLQDKAFLKNWQTMYINCAAFLGEAGKVIFEGMNDADVQLLNSITNTSEFTHTLITEWKSETENMSDKEIIDSLNECSIELEVLLKNYLKELKKNTELNFQLESFSEKIIKHDTLLFYYKVWLPCWIEYQQYLPDLMAKAFQGHFESIEKLLLLDQLILEHDAIRYQWQKIVYENSILADNLHKASKDSPLQNVTMTNLKYLFGALIYQVFNRTHEAIWRVNKQFNLPQVKCKISAENIYELFTAYSQDVLGLAADPDLSSPGTFRTGISRHKNYWDGLFK
jgi:hypothetical protein